MRFSRGPPQVNKSGRWLPGIMLAGTALLTGCTGPAPLRVMLCDANATGDHTARHATLDRLSAVIWQHQPDLVGLQHADPALAQQLRSALPDYGLAVHSGKAQASAGGAAILYRRQRFGLVDAGELPLACSPGGLVATTPRVAAWARLRLNDMPWLELCVVQACVGSPVEHTYDESVRALRRLAKAVGPRPLVVLGELACGHSAYKNPSLVGAGPEGTELREVVCCAARTTGVRWGPRAVSGGHQCILVNRELDATATPQSAGRLDAGGSAVLLADLRLRRWSGYG